jgi:hypothetical protein
VGVEPVSPVRVALGEDANEPLTALAEIGVLME